MPSSLGFETLVREALEAPFVGWDFSFVEARIEIADGAWDYKRLVQGLVGRASSMVDLGTGGGEFIVDLEERPALTTVTEGYIPNVGVAAANLRPMGVHVVVVEDADDNGAQRPSGEHGRLPFLTDTFDLVIDRHESFEASEVARILAPGGTFLTQQIGARNEEALIGLIGSGPPYPSPTLAEYLAQLEAAGLVVEDAREAFVEKRYLDVGALIYFVKAIPWQFTDFSLEDNIERFRPVHDAIERDGSLRTHMHRILLRARKS